MTHRLEITLPDEVWDRLEAARGHEPKASFVKRALESALDRPIADRSSAPSDGGGSAARDSAPGPVSSRAPEEPVAEVLGAKVRKTPSLKDTWGR